MARILFDPYVGANLRLGHRRSYAGLTATEISAMVGGEAAGGENTIDPSAALKSIGIGVATGAITFIVTRLLEKWLK